ncbi:MAG: zinc ribbon domain-containing protein [Firmicutes bacterium]|nr:zinc ribbon domain-containing protein [Bacillota bacterium]
MEELKFSKNYHDLSQQYGVNAGFQFEFYCENCSDTWRTAFEGYKSQQAAEWMEKASGWFGGIVGQAANAVESMAHAGWRDARDKAFARSVEDAKRHFNRCAKCHSYVCDTCWNKKRGLCIRCAPIAEIEMESARAQGETDGATEKAREIGYEKGKQMDAATERQLVCPSCGAQARGAKFCPECGQKLAMKNQCPSCMNTIDPNVKFCPECGHKLK